MRFISTESEFLEKVKGDEPTVVVLFTNPGFPHPAIQRETIRFLEGACSKMEGVNCLWGYTDSLPGLKSYISGIYRPIYLFFGKNGALLDRVEGYTLTEEELLMTMKKLYKRR